MDLTLTCKQIEIDGYDCGYKSIVVKLDTVNISDLNTIEIAQSMDISTFFDAFGEQAIREYVESNYDWFDKEEEI